MKSDWTAKDVEAETQAGYWRPIEPIGHRYRHEKLMAWWVAVNGTPEDYESWRRKNLPTIQDRIDSYNRGDLEFNNSMQRQELHIRQIKAA